ncbi:MAG: hypothetical protein ACLQNE_08285 [Thermoguttaceae bacterium]
MAEYNSGPMPGTDLKYEDFEAFLAGFAATFACLEKSKNPPDPEDYAAIMRILNGFADRYKVQPPLRALGNPRGRRTIVKAQRLTNEEMLLMVNSFGRDFSIGRVYEGKSYDQDASERLQLGRLVLGLLDRYGLADVTYANEMGERVPVKLKRWVTEENRSKYLAERVAAWRNL